MVAQDLIGCCVCLLACLRTVFDAKVYIAGNTNKLSKLSKPKQQLTTAASPPPLCTMCICRTKFTRTDAPLSPPFFYWSMNDTRMYRVPAVVLRPSCRWVRRPGLSVPHPGGVFTSVQFWRTNRVPPPLREEDIGGGETQMQEEEGEVGLTGE